MRAARGWVGPTVAFFAMAAAAAGCQSPAVDVQRAELQTAHERIAALEADVARREAAKPGAEDRRRQRREWKRQALDWQRRDVPAKIRGEAAVHDRPEQLLAALAGELIELRPGEGGDSAILRLREHGPRYIGEIAVRDLPDDSVATLQFRAVLVERDRGWRVLTLAERVICRRGGSGEACL